MPTSSTSSRSSSWPDRPTNGSPRRSSSRPGASPTNIRSASGSPTPKTTWVRVAANGQRVHPAASAASSASRDPGATAASYCRSPPGPVRPTASGRHRHGSAGDASSTRATRSGQVAGHQARAVAERSGPAVDVGAQGGGLERGHPPGQEGADDPGQDVARAGRGQGRGARRASRTRPDGSATAVVGPFSRATAPEARPGGGRRPIRSGPGVSPISRSYSPSWGVSTTGRRASSGAVDAAQGVQAVGVDHHRAPASRPPAPTRPRWPPARPSPGPTTTARHRAATSRAASAHPSPAGSIPTASAAGRSRGRRRARRGGPCRPRPGRRRPRTGRRPRSCPASRRPPARRRPTCCRPGRGRAAGRATSPSSTRAIRCPPTGRPMSTTRTSPASRAPSPWTQARLGGDEGDGARWPPAPTRRPRRCRRPPPRGCRRPAPGCPAATAGRRRCRGIRCRRRRRSPGRRAARAPTATTSSGADHRHPGAPPGQQRGGHPAVGPVVALAADHHDPSAVGAAHAGRARPRPPPSRPAPPARRGASWPAARASTACISATVRTGCTPRPYRPPGPRRPPRRPGPPGRCG